MKTETNRDVILENSLRLFSERGFEGVGVLEMATASGVSKPTMYHYFGSKRGVLDAIMEERGGKLRTEVLPAALYRNNVKNGLEGIFFAYRACFRKDPLFFRLFYSLSAAPPHSEGHIAAYPLYLDLFTALEGFFEAASLDHGNMKGRAKAYAASCIGVLNTYALLEMNGHAELTDAALRQAVHQFMHGIFS
jgi:TetR/AcrR family transcriptional regulator